MLGWAWMEKELKNASLLSICLVIFAALFVLLSFNTARFSDSGQQLLVTDDGFMKYTPSAPQFTMEPPLSENGSSIRKITFSSGDAQISGLLRIPEINEGIPIPAIVLLPGATVTKESEQGLAKYLATLGFATLTIDQRNLGMIDTQSDLSIFLKGGLPTEHKMVYDALLAAEILRNQREIDPDDIIYAGESNGARFAIIAGALDPKARGVLAISTCGYDTDSAIASGKLQNADAIRFYKSIDPDTYLGKIPNRTLVMIHSQNDPNIPIELAEQTYAKAFVPKVMHVVQCAKHGYCGEMNHPLEKELRAIAS
jgi:dipeptidyl aminopeptidase/acylaminoacyl peptidase